MTPPPRDRQGGIVLLAMTIMLAILGALAYTLSSAGAMNSQAVQAQFDVAAAGYLAEAGVHVARWRAQQRNCSDTAQSVTRTLAGLGSYTAAVTGKKNDFDITASGAAPGGASAARSRTKEKGYEKAQDSVTVSDSKDTYITSAAPWTTKHSETYMELTTGAAHGLMQWKMPGELDKALIAKAVLTLIQYQTNSTQAGQSVSVHRVTTEWDESDATWSTAKDGQYWTGGRYHGVAFATAPIGNGTRVWDVTTLIDAWVDEDFTNFGLLLKPAGPVAQARFYSYQSAAAMRPVLQVSFYKKC